MLALREHVPDQSDDFNAFAIELNHALNMLAAVSYAEVARQIHPSLIAPREAWGDGLTAAEFARQVVANEGFLTVEEAGSDSYARDINLRRAAIAEFAYADPAWHRSSDGTYFSVGDGLLLTMRTVYNRDSNEVGFGIEARDGFKMSSDGTDILDAGRVVARGAATDIADAFSSLGRDLEREASLSA